MKHLILLSLSTLNSSLLTLSASAAVPLKWTVETSRATPAQFEAYQGETLALEAALQSYGKPLEAPVNYSLYWQTNGMGSTYWSVPCIQTFEQSEHSNILYATWSPTNDVGAKVYNCFIGQPGTIYHAAFQLRLRPSPGALPNELPLPQKVIDFAKVTVLNPPWSGGGGGVDTNAVLDLIHKTVDGSARYTPKYLWVYDCADSYPEAAAEYYRSRGDGKAEGGCSAVRDGGFLCRNFDYPFDERAEFVVKMAAGTVPSASSPTGASTHRFASVGVAQVGTNLTEAIVTSGKPSRWYKSLPGATVDGINENGVVCVVNVVGGDPHESGWPTNGSIHCSGAVRWVLDHATNAASAAYRLAAEVYFPSGFGQNFHWMVADERETWIVENGVAALFHQIGIRRFPVMTNFRVVLTNTATYNPVQAIFSYYGDLLLASGIERWVLLDEGGNITNAWYTNAYRRETNPPWVSDLRDVLAYTNSIYDAWAAHPKEYFRGKTNNGEPWWQTVHTSVYDISNRVLRVSVQETDDWYTFSVPQSSAAGIDENAVREIVRPMIGAATNGIPEQLSSLASSVSGLESSKRGKTDLAVYSTTKQWTHDDLPEGYEYVAQPMFMAEDDEWYWPSSIDANDAWAPGTAESTELHFRCTDGYEFDARLSNVQTSDTLAKKSELIAGLAAKKDDFAVGNGLTETKLAAPHYRFRINFGQASRFGLPDFCYSTLENPTESTPAYADLACTVPLKEEGFGAANPYVFVTRIPGELHIEGGLAHFLFVTDKTAVNAEIAAEVTKEYVDGSISTNNPAFVSAVRNTPTSDMPEDMPTDWGTYGTVGAALASLAAFVKWAKAKIVAVIGNDGKPTDTFATDLLGKQVAISAVQNIVNGMFDNGDTTAYPRTTGEG